MADPFLGQIMQVGWGYVNVGWANCNGALISVQQNTALFSLLGITFGGNGTQTFGLPDVQGRVLIGQGQGAGLSNYVWGQKAGTENTTLTVSQMPAHVHTGSANGLTGTLTATTGAGTSNAPLSGGFMAAVPVLPPATTIKIYAPSQSGSAVNLNGVTINGGNITTNPAGGSQPFSNLQPYLAVWTLIAMQGQYPTRA